MIDPDQIKRILIIRFSSLGDIVLLTPLFREIKKIFLNAKIDFLTSKEFAGICENNPNIDKQILLERHRLIWAVLCTSRSVRQIPNTSDEASLKAKRRHRRKSKGELRRILKSCRGNEYELIFDAHRSLRSRFLLLRWFGVFGFWSKKIKRVNKRSFKRHILVKFKLNLFRSGILSQRDAYLQMLDDWSPNVLENHSELFPSEEAVEKIDGLQIREKLDFEKVICVAPSASSPGKCWPKGSFKELCEKLVQEGFQVVLLGGSDESETKWVVENSDEKLSDFSGKLTFLESTELLKRSRLAISNDSAVTHLAEAVGTPTVTIFGSTVREFGYAPFLNDSKLLEVELQCRPCSRNGKGKCNNKIKHECLKLISVPRVFETALSVINKL